MSNAKPCKWNDTLYPSIEEAARACGIGHPAMTNRLKKGYTCDDDLRTRPDKPIASEVSSWYTVEPTPTCAFCDKSIIGTTFYIYRKPHLKFCSNQHAEYYGLYGKDKCERRYKGRWVKGA